jgi:hypothetical protein
VKTSLIAPSLFGVVPVLCLLGVFATDRSPSFAEPSHEASVAYFRQMAAVMQHPRCLNCHPQGDRPTQGMDKHVHIMKVTRGPDDHGAVGMRCAACHGSENNLVSGVPGGSNWGLAPRSMGWVGLSLRDLCLAVKDPKKNHGKTLQQLITHNAEEKLVSWAWHPGPGREPAPGTQAEFAENTRKWVEAGAACPE